MASGAASAPPANTGVYAQHTCRGYLFMCTPWRAHARCAFAHACSCACVPVCACAHAKCTGKKKTVVLNTGHFNRFGKRNCPYERVGPVFA